MNDQGITSQISSHIVKGRFDAHIHGQGSTVKGQPGITELIRLSLEKNVPPPLISADALDKAMYKSIKIYEEGQFLLPELIARAKSTAKARLILAKHTGAEFSLSKGKAVLATLYGEDHTRWREITLCILKGLGFNVIDLGAGASVEDLVQSVMYDKPAILGITMPSTSIIPEINAISPGPSISEIKTMLDTLSEKGSRENMKLILGGYAAGIESAEAIGADYCCSNVFQTIVTLRSL